MKFIKLFIYFLLASATVNFVASSAQAEDWFFFGTSNDNDRIFLDRDSIKRKGNIVEVKVFNVLSKEEDGSVGAIINYEFSCQDKKYRYKQAMSLYNDQSTRVFKEISEWEPIKAGIVAEMILQQVCKSQ
ncbi:hypothetical protein F7734_41800 [Scytonema sp. UIC 10036]|uniref:surface-adhesin E family protein n=1 Tax=Scytonema sp. UIC 10036 TaxID=2304196 RepID=UPI0012DA258C|nr:surface-adhesin E family protein [Scytonema sp. UIC 10036]MUG98486.1 hypothetical protein [Scytonema sp. UIC 10036]